MMTNKDDTKAIARLEAFQETMKTQIENLTETVTSGFDKVNDRFDRLEIAYAKKWTEKALVWFFSILGVSLVGFVIWVLEFSIDK